MLSTYFSNQVHTKHQSNILFKSKTREREHQLWTFGPWKYSYSPSHPWVLLINFYKANLLDFYEVGPTEIDAWYLQMCVISTYLSQHACVFTSNIALWLLRYRQKRDIWPKCRSQILKTRKVGPKLCCTYKIWVENLFHMWDFRPTFIMAAKYRTYILFM